MSEVKRFSNQIDALKVENFQELALEIFRFQYNHNKIYKKYVELLGLNLSQIQTLREIPFLPIEFFKSQDIYLSTLDKQRVEAVYQSSGTTSSNTSKHFVFDEGFYKNHSQKLFEDTYGPLSDYIILALLPSYLERENSSLVAMIDHFVQKTKNELSGFYLYNYEELLHTIERIRSSNSSKKILLWGVSFALLDIAEKYEVDLSDCIVLETGGMKGRRQEMTREELHDSLYKGLNVKSVHSEYGMTELLSQSYSKGNGLFYPSKSMRILLREPNDPFSLITAFNKAGGINVVDLANVDSCCFIETKDIGKLHEDGGFEVLGRFDHADIRGCNLLIN